MSKKGFESAEAAWEAIRKLGAFGADMVPYHYRDPVTDERKWFIRRSRKQFIHSDEPDATPKPPKEPNTL